MGVVNAESLLKPLSETEPAGENLRWDRAYLELERLVEGKDATDTAPAEEPDWRQVRDACVELLGRGRHLRIGLFLTLAAVRLEGYTGLRDGLSVIRGWLETNWEHVWPRLDVEDNNDPTERVNSIAAFALPLATFGDKTKFLDRVYEAPLCDSRQLGRFSLRDIAIAAGTLEDKTPQPDGQEPRPRPTLAIIDGAFAETDKEILEATALAADECVAHLEAIDAAFSTHCGAGIGPDLKLFISLLSDAAGQVRRRLGGEAAAGEEGGGSGDGTEGGGGGGGGGRLSGSISSAHDVLNALDKIAHFYAGSERSSPVPLFVQCAKQMVDKDFLDIVRILTPDVVKMLQEVANPPDPNAG